MFVFFLQSMFAQQKSTFSDEVLDDLFLYFVSLINKLKQHSNTLREKKTLKKKKRSRTFTKSLITVIFLAIFSQTLGATISAQFLIAVTRTLFCSALREAPRCVSHHTRGSRCHRSTTRHDHRRLIPPHSLWPHPPVTS